MAYQKLQVSDGLTVIPSSTVRIPDPSSAVNVIDATYTAVDGVTVFSVAANSGSILTGTATEFTKMNIKAGAIIYNTTDTKAYTVKSVDSDTQITLNQTASGSASADITIYNNPTVGCILYVGGTGNLVVQMAAQSGNTTTAATPANHTVTFNSLPNASFLPVQVIRVDDSSTASSLIALW